MDGAAGTSWPTSPLQFVISVCSASRAWQAAGTGATTPTTSDRGRLALRSRAPAIPLAVAARAAYELKTYLALPDPVRQHTAEGMPLAVG